jgi:hypothetical protein
VAFLGQVMSLPMEKSMGKSMGNLVFFMWKWENLWEKYGASNGKIIKVNGKVQDPNIEHPLEKPCFFIGDRIQIFGTEWGWFDHN